MNMRARLKNRFVLFTLATMILPAILANCLGTLHAGVNQWTSHGPLVTYVPDVRTLVVDPQDSNTVFASTSGGIFKSGDSGANWAPLWPVTSPYFTPYLLAVARPGTSDSPQPSTIYAAAPNALFKSADGGANWAQLQSLARLQSAAALVVDPRNANTVFILDSHGRTGSELYKSLDGGLTWNRIWTGALPSAYGNGISLLAVDPADPSVIYAAGLSPVLLRSTDGGANWSESQLPADYIFFNSLALDPQNPNVVYAGGGNSTHGALVRSSDGGTTWVKLELPTDTWVRNLVVDPQNSGAVYASAGGVFKSIDGGAHWDTVTGLTSFAALAVDPGNSHALYAAAGPVIFKSTDGAASWSPASSGLTAARFPYVTNLAVGAGTLYASTFEGVFKSADGATTWRPAAGTGFPSNMIFNAFINPQTPGTVYAFSSSPPSLLKSTDGAESWAESLKLPGTFLAIDPQNANTMYAVLSGEWNDSLKRYRIAVLKSTDGGASWNVASDFLPWEPGYTALVVDPHDSSTLYAEADTYGRIFKSMDGAASWRVLNVVPPDLQKLFPAEFGLFPFSALAVDPQSPGTLYAATGYTGCDAWPCGLPPDYGDPNWAGIGGIGLFKSTDAGETWAKLGFPAIGAGASIILAIDPHDPGTLYASNRDRSVLKSSDGGATWNAVGSLLPSFANALAVDPDTPGRVYAGTWGAGVFEITLGAQ